MCTTPLLIAPLATPLLQMTVDSLEKAKREMDTLDFVLPLNLLDKAMFMVYVKTGRLLFCANKIYNRSKASKINLQNYAQCWPKMDKERKGDEKVCQKWSVQS